MACQTVPSAVPTAEHGEGTQLRTVPRDASRLAARPARASVHPMRTTYDLTTSLHPRSQASTRSPRRYSRHAQTILSFFSEHRTALAVHVQRQFRNLFGTDRTTRMHLQTLVARNHLAVLSGRGIGQANVYLLTERGLRTLQRHAAETADDERRPRRHLPTGSHLTHELLITELAVSLTDAIRTRPDLTLPWAARFDLTEHDAFRSLVPDYAFLLKHAQGLLACFVEVFSGEESPTRIGQKLQAYATWAVSPETQDFLVDLYRTHGAEQPRPHFRLLIVAHDRRTGNDQSRLRQILAQALSLPRAMRQRLWAVTVADLAAARNIDAPVWFRARDLEPRDAEWDSLPRAERRRRFTMLYRSLPRHRLFPSLEDQSHDASLEHQPDRLVHPAVDRHEPHPDGVRGP